MKFSKGLLGQLIKFDGSPRHVLKKMMGLARYVISNYVFLHRNRPCQLIKYRSERVE